MRNFNQRKGRAWSAENSVRIFPKGIPTEKTKGALEAIKGLQTIHEIAHQYEVHPNQVSNWKKQILERLPQVFSDKSGASKEYDREKEMLYQQIGQLQVELTW